LSQLNLSTSGVGNAGEVLKVFYLGPLREQLNTATVLLSKLDREEGTQDVYGKSFTVPLHVGRNLSAGIGRAEDGTLPTAGAQSYKTAVVPNKYVYGRIQLTGQVIKATKNSAGSFIKAIDSEVKGLTRDMKKAINRQLHSDGTDALGFWTAADNTSGTNIDDGQGNAFIHVQSGGTYDLIDATDNDTTIGDSIVVTVGAKGSTDYAITWTGTVTGSADGDYLVPEDSLGYQMMGIAGIIDGNRASADPVVPAGGGTKTGLHGLAYGTYDYWNAQVFHNSGTKRAMSLELLQDPLSEIHVQSDFSESDVKFLLSNVWMRDKYVALCQSMRRIVNEMELDGGFSGVEFNGKPWVIDSQCKRNRVYYIVPETMKIFRNADFDWMDMDGAVLSRVANKDAYEAVLYHYGDLACVTRNANGLLDDIID
jgi:hypothetical protein